MLPNAFIVGAQKRHNDPMLCAERHPQAVAPKEPVYFFRAANSTGLDAGLEAFAYVAETPGAASPHTGICKRENGAAFSVAVASR